MTELVPQSEPEHSEPDGAESSAIAPSSGSSRHPFVDWEALGRASGALRSDGNQIKLQVDGPSTFDTWLEAIRSAEHFVHFENYILRDDRVGRAFRHTLIEKAKEGVKVRVLYDWFGCWATPRSYWKPFRAAGVEVRAFNKPGLRDPFGILQRDHRKLVCVDGKVAYFGGLCVGEEWAGKDGAQPWRDAGVEVRGPAAVVAAGAFERIWAEMGPPAEPSNVRVSEESKGHSPVWLIEGEPGRSRVYRVLNLVSAHARERIWITDPYFVAPRPVTESLMAAARAGVDVRVLLPANNNWPWVGSLSRGGYRGLLRAGVRIFEWQGPMIHAKTTVADGVWCRVGSSNLNAASLLGNWEVDVGVWDAELAHEMEDVFLADLETSIEIVLPGTVPVQSVERTGPPTLRRANLESERNFNTRLAQLRGGRRAAGTANSRLARIVRAGSALSGAIAGHRPLGREDRTLLGTASILLLFFAGILFLFPVWTAWAIALLLAWLGTVGGVRAFVQAKRAREADEKLEADEKFDAHRRADLPALPGKVEEMAKGQPESERQDRSD